MRKTLMMFGQKEWRVMPGSMIRFYTLLMMIIACGSMLANTSLAMGRAGIATTAIGDLAFSPDGNTLVFREYKSSEVRGLGFLNLRTGERKFLAAPEGHLLSGPSYSPDGKQIVAALFESANQSQLIIMDVDGSNMRDLTQGRGCRTAPDFSPDGHRVIFSFSSLPETGASKKCIDEDVFEINIDTLEVHQLTNNKFYNLSSPHYLPDGHSIIFSGDGPSEPIGSLEYERKYGENQIFTSESINGEFGPAIAGYEYSTWPVVSQDGKIVFKVRSNDLDGLGGPYNYDLFIRENGRDMRLTRLMGAIMYPVISPDGRFIAFFLDSSSKRRGYYELMIMNSDGSGLRRLGISGRLF